MKPIGPAAPITATRSPSRELAVGSARWHIRRPPRGRVVPDPAHQVVVDPPDVHRDGPSDPPTAQHDVDDAPRRQQVLEQLDARGVRAEVDDVVERLRREGARVRREGDRRRGELARRSAASRSGERGPLASSARTAVTVAGGTASRGASPSIAWPGSATTSRRPRGARVERSGEAYGRLDAGPRLQQGDGRRRWAPRRRGSGSARRSRAPGSSARRGARTPGARPRSCTRRPRWSRGSGDGGSRSGRGRARRPRGAQRRPRRPRSVRRPRGRAPSGRSPGT